MHHQLIPGAFQAGYITRRQRAGAPCALQVGNPDLRFVASDTSLATDTCSTGAIALYETVSCHCHMWDAFRPGNDLTRLQAGAICAPQVGPQI